jgi:AbrB family looped-hinge helix DNA binding protein
MEIKEEMKVGPKGQVVIPKVFRKALGIVPGSTVVMKIKNGNIIIEKPKKDVAGIFKEIAFSGTVKKIHPHYGYETSLKKRIEKASK